VAITIIRISKKWLLAFSRCSGLQAKAQIGKQHEEWPPLAPSTLAKKSADTPLLETGEMRDSIEWIVRGHGSHG